MLPTVSSFMVTSFRIIFALFANSRVDIVSLMWKFDGLMFAIIKVLLLPPKEFFKINVSLLSLYGTCVVDFFSVRALITFPRADSDLLIFPASLSLSPYAWVSLVLSDPARSMIWNVDDLTEHIPFSNDLLSIKVERTECDLELCSFILVAPTCLFLVPNSIKATTSS